MTLSRISRRLALAALLSVAAVPAMAQTWPDKPVTLVVGFSPGGFTDALARILAQKLQERLGQPFVVENKPGAAGTIAADQVAQGQAGRLHVADRVTATPTRSRRRCIRSCRTTCADFTPIAFVASTPFLLTVHPSVTATDVKTFIDDAQKHPLRYASSGKGSGQHLAAERFMLMTGIR